MSAVAVYLQWDDWTNNDEISKCTFWGLNRRWYYMSTWFALFKAVAALHALRWTTFKSLSKDFDSPILIINLSAGEVRLEWKRKKSDKQRLWHGNASVFAQVCFTERTNVCHVSSHVFPCVPFFKDFLNENSTFVENRSLISWSQNALTLTHCGFHCSASLQLSKKSCFRQLKKFHFQFVSMSLVYIIRHVYLDFRDRKSSPICCPGVILMNRPLRKILIHKVATGCSNFISCHFANSILTNISKS